MPLINFKGIKADLEKKLGVKIDYEDEKGRTLAVRTDTGEVVAIINTKTGSVTMTGNESATPKSSIRESIKKSLVEATDDGETPSAFDTIFESLDLSKIEGEVSKALGTPVKLEKTKGKGWRNEYFIKLTSEELISKAGIFQSVLSSARLECIGTLMAKKSEGTSGPTLFLKFNLQYSSRSGGSNGLELITVWYDTSDHSVQSRQYFTR